MNVFKTTLFTFLMTFFLVFVGEVEAKKNHKSHKHAHSRAHSHPKGHQHKSNTNKKTSTVFQQNKKNNSQSNISPSALSHIKDRHWHNASQGANTSHFSQSMTDKKLNRLATKTINKGSQRPSTHGQGRSTHQYTFNKPIGTTTTGQKAHALRVVTDANNNVITAFPVK